jgi:hypothetical protein
MRRCSGCSTSCRSPRGTVRRSTSGGWRCGWADPATAPHAHGGLAIDDSGDREDGRATAHVGRQWLGRYGQTDNSIVTVPRCGRMSGSTIRCTPSPYTPASHFPKDRTDSDFRTKLQIAADLVAEAREAGVVCRAVVADFLRRSRRPARRAARDRGHHCLLIQHLCADRARSERREVHSSWCVSVFCSALSRLDQAERISPNLALS